MNSNYFIDIFRIFVVFTFTFQMSLHAGSVAFSGQDLYVQLLDGALQIITLTNSSIVLSRTSKNKCESYNATLIDQDIVITGQNAHGESCVLDFDSLASTEGLSIEAIVGITIGTVIAIVIFVGVASQRYYKTQEKYEISDINSNVDKTQKKDEIPNINQSVNPLDNPSNVSVNPLVDLSSIRE